MWLVAGKGVERQRCECPALTRHPAITVWLAAGQHPPAAALAAAAGCTDLNGSQCVPGHTLRMQACSIELAFSRHGVPLPALWLVSCYTLRLHRPQAAVRPLSS